MGPLPPKPPVLPSDKSDTTSARRDWRSAILVGVAALVFLSAVIAICCFFVPKMFRELESKEFRRSVEAEEKRRKDWEMKRTVSVVGSEENNCYISEEEKKR
jgi:hypothetical protein